MLFKRVQNEGAQIKRHPDFNALKSYLGIMRLMLYRGMPICVRAPIQVSGSLNPRDPVSLSPWVHGSLGLKSPKPPRFPRSSPQLPFFLPSAHLSNRLASAGHAPAGPAVSMTPAGRHFKKPFYSWRVTGRAYLAMSRMKGDFLGRIFGRNFCVDFCVDFLWIFV